MDLKNELKKLAVSMISAHQEFSFKNMGMLMDQSEISKIDTFFTKDKFDEVCEKLSEKCGEMKSIEYIGGLNKGESLQTLWKVKYTKAKQEIL